VRRAANREWFNKREREYDKAHPERIRERKRRRRKAETLAYAFLRQLGAVVHLPKKDQRPRFSYQVVKQLPGVLPTTPTTNQKD
jgi:hypothetical protein